MTPFWETKEGHISFYVSIWWQIRAEEILANELLPLKKCLCVYIVTKKIWPILVG